MDGQMTPVSAFAPVKCSGICLVANTAGYWEELAVDSTASH